VLRADPGLIFPSMVRAAPQDYAIAAAWVLVILALVIAGSRASHGAGPLAADTA
jgi:hypothetical protein